MAWWACLLRGDSLHRTLSFPWALHHSSISVGVLDRHQEKIITIEGYFSQHCRPASTFGSGLNVNASGRIRGIELVELLAHFHC